MTAIVVEQLKSAGELTLPGLVKLTAVHKPATPEREGVNPFTKQPITIKAKPASTTVKGHAALPGDRDRRAGPLEGIRRSDEALHGRRW